MAAETARPLRVTESLANGPSEALPWRLAGVIIPITQNSSTIGYRLLVCSRQPFG